MWKAFEGSFTRALQSVLNYDEAKAKDVTAKADTIITADKTVLTARLNIVPFIKFNPFLNKNDLIHQQTYHTHIHLQSIGDN